MNLPPTIPCLLILCDERREEIVRSSRSLELSCNFWKRAGLGTGRGGKMESMNERVEQRNSVNRAELAERIASVVREDGVVQPMPGLYLTRNSQPGRRVYGVTIPSLCVIAQGAKEIYIGEN